jgi:hypothetical protein
VSIFDAETVRVGQRYLHLSSAEAYQ